MNIQLRLALRAVTSISKGSDQRPPGPVSGHRCAYLSPGGGSGVAGAHKDARGWMSANEDSPKSGRLVDTMSSYPPGSPKSAKVRISSRIHRRWLRYWRGGSIRRATPYPPFPGCSLVSSLCPPFLLALVQREPPRVRFLGNSEAQRAACCFCLRTTKTGQCACRTTLSATLPISALLTPPWPRLPITIRPAPISSARRTIS